MLGSKAVQGQVMYPHAYGFKPVEASRVWQCPLPQAQDAEPPRHLAFGRGRDHHCRPKALAVAGRGSGWLLDETVQTRRDTKAAKRLLKRLLKKQGGPPRRTITDKLGSSAAARRQILPAVEHRSHKGLNNRAENAHLPQSRRERAMRGFRPPGGLQRFVNVFSAVRSLFVPPRSRHSALAIHLHRLSAMVGWRSAAGLAA